MSPCSQISNKPGEYTVQKIQVVINQNDPYLIIYQALICPPKG